MIELSIIELLLEGKKDGKRERGRLKRQWERDVQDIFDMSVTEVGRLAIDRKCLRGVVKDATSYRDKQSAVSSQYNCLTLKRGSVLVRFRMPFTANCKRQYYGTTWPRSPFTSRLVCIICTKKTRIFYVSSIRENHLKTFLSSVFFMAVGHKRVLMMISQHSLIVFKGFGSW